MFRALRSRNYQLYFSGQLVSLVGTWLAHVAMSWLVYRLTGSKLLLGLVAFMGQIPSFALGPFTGVLIDRWDLRRTIIATQALAMLQAATLAILTLTGVVTVAHVVILAAALGLINAFDMPARQAFIVQMLDRREDLGNAIALNSSMFNAARILGPAAAGILVAAVGEGLCFLFNSLSFLAVIAALLAMRLTPVERNPAKKAWKELRDGLGYVRDSVPIRSALLLMALVSVSGVPYMVLMPVFASDILHGGPRTLGFLSASSGAGALIGALALAARPSVRGLERTLVVATAGFGAALILFALSRWFALSVLILPLAGFSAITLLASCNTLLQTFVDDAMRGRVMAFYGMAFMGMMPFGSLLTGALAETSLGAPGTVMINGSSCILAAIIFARKVSALRAELERALGATGSKTTSIGDGGNGM